MKREGGGGPFPAGSPGPGDPRPARLQALGLAAGELLHDLAGSLALLSGRVALARDEAALGRVPSVELRKIESDADQMRRMVLDLLGELRGEPVSPDERFALDATLHGVAGRWIVSAPPLDTTIESELPVWAGVAGPRSFFERALGNLLRNAARHARSRVRLTALPLDGGARARILVEDDGRGVPDSMRERVFDPFCSGEKGAGLGLSFARWGVERLGGTLTLDDRPSPLGGAAFRIELPVVTLTTSRSDRSPEHRPLPPHAGEPATPSPALREGAAGGGMGASEADLEPHLPRLDGVRLVLVDDDAGLRSTFVRLFRRAGAEAVALEPAEWHSLQEAVARIRLAGPDVILLDLDLQGWSGAELVRTLEVQAPSLAERVVFFTGGPGPADCSRIPVVSKLTPWDGVVRFVQRIAR